MGLDCFTDSSITGCVGGEVGVLTGRKRPENAEVQMEIRREVEREPLRDKGGRRLRLGRGGRLDSASAPQAERDGLCAGEFA